MNIITILCNIPDVFLLFLSHITEVSEHNKSRENAGNAVNRCRDETIPAKLLVSIVVFFVEYL